MQQEFRLPDALAPVTLVSPEDDGISIETCTGNVSVYTTMQILCIVVGLL
jgi:hypothetical protein